MHTRGSGLLFLWYAKSQTESIFCSGVCEFTEKELQLCPFLPFPDCDIVGKVNGVCFTFSKEGRPSGEAFIELKTSEDFKKALAKDRKYMGHRYIEGTGHSCSQCRKDQLEFLSSVDHKR